MNTDIIYANNDDYDWKQKKRRENDLKLRIHSYIEEPLQLKGNCWRTCCLCCTDLVDPLSNEERAIKLIIGYIRKYTRYDPGTAVLLLCIYYVGNASAFDAKQLISNTQRRHEEWSQRKQRCIECPKQCRKQCRTWCTNCIGADRIERHHQKWLECKERCYFCIICWLFLYFMLKDVVLLVMMISNDCNAAIQGESKYVAFDVNEWMKIAAITHSVYTALLCVLGCYVDLAVCIMCVVWCFFIAWIIIGILLYSETSGTEQCGSMILSWCILQTIEFFLTACCVWSIMTGR